MKRELKEETGLKPSKIKNFRIHGKYNYKRKYPERIGFIGQSYSLYSAEVKKLKLKIDSREHSNSKWLEFDKAVKKLTWPNQKKSLRIVNGWLKEEHH